MSGLSGLLDLSRRALFAQTQSIRVLGNNVANVNTPGYSRRQVQLVAQGIQAGGFQDAFGVGVNINRVIRVVDSFLNNELQLRIGSRAHAEARYEFIARAEAAFSLDQTVGRIGYQLSEFFSALEDVATDPANIALRSAVVDKGQALTQAIQNTYSIVADLQREADNRIGVVINEVNQLTSQIAELNGLLSNADGSSGQDNLTLLDKRDQLLRELSEKIGIQTVENSDGSILVTLNNGFGLVTGASSRALEFTPSPSFAPVGGYPTGLDGRPLGHIVFDFDSTLNTSHVDLTSLIGNASGELGGLLRARGIQDVTDTTPFDAVGDLVDIASRVEAIAQDLLTRFNTEYLGEFDEDTTTPGFFDPSSGDLNGNAPNIYGLFTFAGAADSNGDGLPNDLVDNGLSSYARVISFAFSDPNRFAAALDLDPTDGSTSFVSGDGSNIGGLLALRDERITHSVGNFSLTATLEEVYDSTVTHVGGLSARARNDLQVSEDRETQQFELLAAVSGVSLDEEFAKLINFQRAFEASARMIRVGDELFGEIIGLLR
jgi:flagellar hook-associated protein 1